MSQLDELKQRLIAVIKEYKILYPAVASQTASPIEGPYCTVNDSQPTKNADGLWTVKRTITKRIGTAKNSYGDIYAATLGKNGEPVLISIDKGETELPNTAKDADQNLTNLIPILAQNGQDSYTVELIWETNAQTYQFQISDLGIPTFSVVGEKRLWCVKRVIKYDPKQKKGVIQTNIHKNTTRIGSNAEPEFNTESVNSNELIKFIRQYEETKIAMQKLETDGVKAKVEIDICWEEISKNQTGMNCFGLGQTELSKEQLMEKFGNAEFPIMKRIVTENSDALIFLSNLHSTTEKNIREIFIDLGLSSIFIVSSKRFEYLCDSSGFFGCYALTLQ